MSFTLLGSRFVVRVQVRAAVAVIALCAATMAHAEVTRVEVTSRVDLAYAGYEKIVGRLYFAVDPADARNAVVADIDKAPRNAAGRVEFSADFYALRPKSAGNGVAIVDIVNRGNRTVTRRFNRATGGDADVGDAFLMRRGFTVVAVGWEFDLPDTGQLLRVHVPVASEGGRTITGIVRAIFTVNRREPTFTVDDLAAYPPVDAGGADTALTVRDRLSGPAQALPRTTWRLSGEVVSLDGGFEPGRIYEIAYRAADPPVAGLGFAAIRDAVSWIKHASGAVAPAKYVYTYGQSQSGRFLRDFLYHGFNSDERGRLVFDGVMAHIAGAARIDVNRRWSTPTAGDGFVGGFPFATSAQRDPVSGVTEGLLDNARARRNQPKIFFTNSAVEYWIDVGRAAALIHTTPDGSRDLALADNTRAYLVAGAQHTPGAFPPAQGPGQQRANPTDDGWVLRALLAAMDRWVREGVAPPSSRHPRHADGTLVKAQDVAFPPIPGVQSPQTVPPARRAANLLIAGGAGEGATMPLLVSQVDADGNEVAGIRVPETAVPLATYSGWNFRSAAVGATGRMLGNTGSYIPFARTEAERTQRGDPRPSIEARYPSRGVYLSKIRDAAAALVRDRYLLPEDVDAVVGRASDHWDLAAGSTTTSSSSR